MIQEQRPKSKIITLLRVLEELTDEDNRLNRSEIMEEMKKRGVPISKAAVTDSLGILEDMGFDVDCKEDGNRGNKYCLLSREIELHEVNILIDAVQASRFISVKKSSELTKKLQNLVSIHQARKIKKRMFFEGRVKAKNENVFYSIDEIIRALDGELWIKFDYYHYDARKQFIKKSERHLAHPFAIVWEEDCYYMIAVLFDLPPEKLTHFRIDRMNNVVSLDDVSSHVAPKDWLIYEQDELDRLMQCKKEFNIDDYMRKTFKMYTGEPCRVVLRFHESILNSMIDRFGSDSNIRPDKSGYFKLHADIYLSDGFYYWLLSFADKIELLEPKHARVSFKKLIAQTQQLYN